MLFFYDILNYGDVMKIQVLKNGPYLVTGNIPLYYMTIDRVDGDYIYINQEKILTKETYILCRCGESKKEPFCDNKHIDIDFNGSLTAPLSLNNCKFKTYEGERLLLKDFTELCSYARHCHSKNSDIWKEVLNNNDESAIKLMNNCPSGRLILIDKTTNKTIEPHLEPSIVLLQDPLNGCSGPIWVRGSINVFDEDGNLYEPRNRITLCRCGSSNNKPFCDSKHVDIRFRDNKI